MSDTYDGGPAFPSAWHPVKDGYKRGDCGMSLRDYFAGQALTSQIPASAAGLWNPMACATRAYEFADAMLKAREAQPEPTLTDQLKASLADQERGR